MYRSQTYARALFGALLFILFLMAGRAPAVERVAAQTPSGAGETGVVNGDFAGVPTTSGTIPGWTGSGTMSGGFVPNVSLLTSTPFTLDFPSDGGRSWFRVGYRLDAGSGLTVSFGTTQVFTSSTSAGDPVNTWLERYFSVLDNVPNETDTLKLQGTGNLPDVAYVERLDGPTARGVPRLGLTLDPTFPKPHGAVAAGGIDMASGAFLHGATDLALSGLRRPLTFVRAYNNQSVTSEVRSGALFRGPIGPKWSHSWQYRLKSVAPDDATIVLFAPGGGRYAFNFDTGFNLYLSPFGAYGSLNQDSATQFTLTTHESDEYVFDNERLVSMKDRSGNTTTLTYDGSGRLTTVTDPGGRTLTLTYDASNRVATAKDNTNRTVTYAYDGTTGDLSTVTDVISGTVSFTYDKHWLKQGTDQRSKLFVRNTFDQRGRVLTQRDATNNQSTVAYATPAAGVTTFTDPRSQPTKFYFDALLRITDVVNPLNYRVSRTYDTQNSNVLTVTDSAGHSLAYTYDADDNVLTATEAGTNTATYTWNSANNTMLTAKDALNHTTTFTYNASGERSTIKDALNNTVTYTRNSKGQITGLQNARGQNITIGYNTPGDVTSITYPTGTPSVAMQYDNLGRRTQITDGTGTTTYVYNARNQPTSITHPGSRTVGYGYDAAGNRTSLTHPGSTGQAQYTYDDANRLLTAKDWNNQTTSYAYDAASRMTTMTLPSGTGIVSTYAYDNANRLTSVVHKKGTTTLASATYTLNAAGRRDSKATLGGTESYTYDTLDRITGVTYPGGGGSTTYTLDAAGNRLTHVTSAGTTSYAYDNADRLTSVTPPGSGAVTYTNDADGNRTGKSSETFAWNAAGRLTSHTAGAQTTTYTYNGDGLRATRAGGGTTATFTWDVTGLATVIDDGAAKYLYGAGLVSRVATGGTVYYLSDGLGSTMALVDGSGAVVHSYEYDAFGTVRSGSGTHANEYQFTGQQVDTIGLQYLRDRYYDPTTGRFLSKDSVLIPGTSNQLNRFAYVRNNPVNASDPSGRICVDDSGAYFGCTSGEVSGYYEGWAEPGTYSGSRWDIGNAIGSTVRCFAPGNACFDCGAYYGGLAALIFFPPTTAGGAAAAAGLAYAGALSCNNHFD